MCLRRAQVEVAIARLPLHRQREHMAHFWTALQREVAMRKCATITVSLERVFREGPLVAAAKERNVKDLRPPLLGGQPRGNGGQGKNANGGQPYKRIDKECRDWKSNNRQFCKKFAER
eukprot:3364219-Pleurochrysis_carterae.AAC.1